MKEKIKIGLYVLAGILIVILGIGFFRHSHVALAEGTCEAGEKSAFLSVPSGIYTDDTGQKVFIQSGIALGKSSVDSNVNETLPSCNFQLKGLHLLRNRTLTADDGTKYLLVKGIGSDGSVKEEIPAPLP